MERVSNLETLRSLCDPERVPIPDAGTRLALEITAEDDIDDSQIVEHFESEARLRYFILVAGNFSLPAGHEPVKSASKALSQLGRARCHELLWLLVLSDQYQTFAAARTAPRRRLWRHAVLKGVVAQQFVAEAGFATSARGLAAGMALDVGRLVASQRAAPHEASAIAPDVPVPVSCRPDDNSLACALLELWNAPEWLVAVVRHRHDPKGAPEPLRWIVTAAALAELVAEKVDDDRHPTSSLPSTPEWTKLAAIGPYAQIADLHGRVLERLPDSLMQAERLARLIEL